MRLEASKERETEGQLLRIEHEGNCRARKQFPYHNLVEEGTSLLRQYRSNDGALQDKLGLAVFMFGLEVLHPRRGAPHKGLELTKRFTNLPFDSSGYPGEKQVHVLREKKY